MFARFIKIFLPLVFAITFAAGLTYIIAQQDLRVGANDPQIQMALDLSNKLATGVNAKTLVDSANTIDIAGNLNTFVIVYDENGKVISSSGILDGKFPTPPMGVFDHAKVTGQDRVTWQPKSGVRIAAVVNSFDGKSKGYVLVGRNLMEVEKRESTVALKVGISWLAGIFGAFILSLFLKLIKEK
ncbi:MAG TPA: hypothetical protein VKC54_01775 [Patescibacteria group bacterium]|nr:hypothetical protein [Patescibacteria group bacterium]